MGLSQKHGFQFGFYYNGRIYDDLGTPHDL